MQAVILAGGMGTRLRPIIGDLPKSLAPIHGQPFLEYQVESLRAAGFRRLVFCTGYGHKLIQAHFRDGAAFGVQIVYSVEQQALGTAGALRHVQTYLDDTFLVLNGDTFFSTDFHVLVNSHTSTQSLVTIALVHVPDIGRFGRVDLDAGGYITRFNEKSSTGPGLINAGVYVFALAIFHHLTDQIPLSLETQTFPALARQRFLRGCVLEGYHIDIGTPESYLQFQQDVISGYLSKSTLPRVKR